MFEKTGYFLGFVFLLLSLFALDNCRPKGDNDVMPMDSTALSSCILLNEKINGVLLRAYEYDTTRKLTYMTEYSGSSQLNKIVKRYTFEYNNSNRLTVIRETNLAERDKSFIYELDYNSKSQVKTIRPFRVYNSGTRAEDTLSLVYGTNDRVAELTSLRGVTSKWEYDTANNVKKWLIRTPLMKSDSLLAEYGSSDDKVNIYSFSQGMQLINLLTGRAHSRRNPIKYTSLGQSVEASYQYNEKRVPTLAVLKIKSSDNLLRETVYAYELNCK